MPFLGGEKVLGFQLSVRGVTFGGDTLFAAVIVLQYDRLPFLADTLARVESINGELRDAVRPRHAPRQYHSFSPPSPRF
jgi:hypothetical protein